MGVRTLDQIVELLTQNLISPIVLAFVLGMVARAVRSDLEIPPALYQGLSIYLLLAIGLKGGVALAETPMSELIGPLSVTVVLGLITPISAYFLLSRFGKLQRIDAAATAAHYGSVSAVTFLAAIEATKNAGLEGNGYLPALVAVLEVPGIIVGLMLARQTRVGGMKAALHEVVAGKSIFLLIGGMMIGALCGPVKMESVAPLFVDPFKGVLCLFLLELGMLAAGRLRDLKKAGWRWCYSGVLSRLCMDCWGRLLESSAAWRRVGRLCLEPWWGVHLTSRLRRQCVSRCLRRVRESI